MLVMRWLPAARLIVVQPRHRPGSGQPGDLPEDLVVVGDVVAIDARHVGALAGDRLHESFAVQGDQGLAHREPADAQLVGDGVLVDALAGLQPPGEDRGAEVGRDLLGEVGPAPGGRQGGRGHDSSIQVVLRSVNLSMAWSDLSLPKPDCLTPPKGTVRSPSS